MEHPSISRLHAVLQFRASDGAAFLYDPGSAHGTLVNKQRIPAQQYVPIRCALVCSAGLQPPMCASIACQWMPEAPTCSNAHCSCEVAGNGRVCYKRS